MIDRIEELLGSLAAEENDEEKQEDVLALPVAEEAVPASPRGDGGEAGDGETGDRSGGRTVGEIVTERPGLIAGEAGDGGTGDRSGGRSVGEIVTERPGQVAGETGDSGTGDRSGGRTAGEIAPERPGLVTGEVQDGETGDRSGGRTAGEIILERPGLVAGETGDGEEGDRSGGRTAGEIALEQPGLIAGETWKDGPVWTVRRVEQETDRARRTAAAERTAQAEEASLPTRDGEPIWSELERAARVGTVGPAQAGLKGLYRQTVQGLRPAAPTLSPEQAGRTAQAQEPGSAASLAVDELDRAVRRDSRRYDGGMSIF